MVKKVCYKSYRDSLWIDRSINILLEKSNVECVDFESDLTLCDYENPDNDSKNLVYFPLNSNPFLENGEKYLYYISVRSDLKEKMMIRGIAPIMQTSFPFSNFQQDNIVLDSRPISVIIPKLSSLSFDEYIFFTDAILKTFEYTFKDLSLFDFYHEKCNFEFEKVANCRMFPMDHNGSYLKRIFNSKIIISMGSENIIEIQMIRSLQEKHRPTFFVENIFVENSDKMFLFSLFEKKLNFFDMKYEILKNNKIKTSSIPSMFSPIISSGNSDGIYSIIKPNNIIGILSDRSRFAMQAYNEMICKFKESSFLFEERLPSLPTGNVQL